MSPFIYIIRTIFEAGYNLTGNYGLSIVLLSFAISLLLLPIFIYIEKAKKRDDRIKKHMQPLVSEIKQVYTGQERYYYLKTLNRQFGYSQFKALVPILSLLVQIPFFIAAYQYLDNLEALQGVSFGPLTDLSKPDHLIESINVLPILMTVVNLLTAWFYTRNSNTSERKQMVVIAGIFLFLLYNLPSGLVLYWTMNNVFAFLRLFITNREVFVNNEKSYSKLFSDIKTETAKIQDKLINTGLLLLTVGFGSQLQWALNHNFNGFIVRVAIVVVTTVFITLIIALLVGFSTIDFKIGQSNIKKTATRIFTEYRVLFYILLSITVFAQINRGMSYGFHDIGIRIILSGLASLMFVYFVAIIALYYKGLLLNTKLIGLSLKHRSKIYFILYIILSFLAAGVQLNWASSHSFGSVIWRILISLLAVRLIVVLMAWFTYNLSLVRKWIIKVSGTIRSYYGKARIVLILTILAAILSQLNWALNHNFSDFPLRLICSILGANIIFPIIVFCRDKLTFLVQSIDNKGHSKSTFEHGLLLSIYFYCAAVFYYSGINFTLVKTGFVILLLTQFISVNQLIVAKSKQSLISRVLLFSVLFIQICTIILTVLKPDVAIHVMRVTFDLKSIQLNNVLFIGIIYGIVAWMLQFYTRKHSVQLRRPASFLTYFLGLIFLFSFIFFWQPLFVYASYPTDFDFPAIEILRHNFLKFIIPLLSLLLVFFIVPKQIQYSLLKASMLLVIISFVHSTIMPIDLGTLQEMKFTKEGALAIPYLFYFLEAILIVYALYLFDKYSLKITRYSVQIMLLLNVTIAINGVYQAIQTGTFIKKSKIIIEDTPLISFSKEKENIVVVITDMFNGYYMRNFLDEDPDLYNQLSGFKWYSNTLSVSSITGSSIGPMLMGYNYTADKLNEIDTPIEDKLTTLTEDFYTKVKNSGRDFTSTKLIYSKIDNSKFDTYLPKWTDKWNIWNKKLKIGLIKDHSQPLLWQNALLHSAPLPLKASIYNSGKWFINDTISNENSTRTQDYNFLRLLPYISNTENQKANFIFLHTYASHHPWDVVNKDGQLLTDTTVFENNRWTINELAKWIDWIKENNVYDNTKIIIASDHGPHWWHDKEEELKMNIPPFTTSNTAIELEDIMSLFPLLLVKDFNKTGKLEIDNRLMSNADIPAIVFDENDPTKIKAEDFPSRTLPSSNIIWVNKLSQRNNFVISKKFKVTDDIYNLENWKEVK
ncbi:MAG TPA: membrane protein insertase YidC [Draconibacterium sp.]|nr:membrane protein insertase YidC [Draconibacterium sp.]